jgi:hypothetical protein
MNDKEGINILPVVNGGGNTDTATAMAMMNNNPWMYLVMLALFGNGTFGNRGAGTNGVLDIETQNKLNSLQSQINDNNNNSWAREAIQGNTFAISQLSQSLGVNYNSLVAAVGTVKDAVFQLGAQNGMGFAGVINNINLGNLNLVQQLKDCCCGLKTQILEQGYQGQLITVGQTNELKDSQRVENGLTRAEIASFRQAWEQNKYNEALAKAERLQTELDLLRTQQNDVARFNTLEGQFRHLEWEMQQLLSLYGGKAAVQTAGGQ